MLLKEFIHGEEEGVEVEEAGGEKGDTVEEEDEKFHRALWQYCVNCAKASLVMTHHIIMRLSEASLRDV